MSDRELIAHVYMSEEARRFITSDLGQYIMARVAEEEREALEALGTVSPWRRRRITQLQNQLWRVRSVNAWLNDLIVSGDNALKVLEGNEHDN